MRISAGRTLYLDHIDRFASSMSIGLKPVTQSFLTCYHFPIVTYAFYLSPFELEQDVWMAFLVFCTLMCILLKVIIFIGFGNHKFFGLSAFLFVLSTIMDDSCGMPNQLKRSWKIRFLFGPWFLTSVVLVNGYIGLAISSLTTPFKLKSVDFF